MPGLIPQPTPETKPYWDAAIAGELRLPWCAACEKYIYYPRAHCPQCGSGDLHWLALSGNATLLSYVINERPFPPFEPKPMVVALVQLREGPQMMTNIV